MPFVRRLRDSWNSFGKDDAQWAVLTDMTGRMNDLDDFFATGRDEVDVVFDLAGQNDWNLQTGTALDYGCGIGRVSQALAERFDDVLGVDIAPSMIEQARRLNQHGDSCRYQLNEKGDLDAVPANHFDFVFCKIVLQHMGAQLAAQRIQELVACMRPGGLLLFQIPSHFVGRAQLSEDSFQAAIDDVTYPQRVETGATVSVGARVKNVSARTWPAGNDAAIALGCYWARDGARTNLAEGRMFLTHDIDPGAELAGTMEMPAPARPGRYDLVIDLVQESVTWFGDHGSPTIVHPVDVVGDPPKRSIVATARGIGSKLLGRRPHEMVMDGIPRPEVEALLARSGAEVLLVQQDRAAPEWESYTYWVTKPGPKPSPR